MPEFWIWYLNCINKNGLEINIFSEPSTAGGYLWKRWMLKLRSEQRTVIAAYSYAFVDKA